MTAYVPGITEIDLKKIVLAIQQLAAGRSNAVGTVRLTTGTATEVNDRNCAVGSVPLFTPSTVEGATEISNGTMYVSSVANGSFIITHANSASTERKFLYALHG